jgi:hypothetical protein
VLKKLLKIIKNILMKGRQKKEYFVSVVILTNIISYILYIIDNKTMSTTQIKPFDVFTGTKTASQSTNNTSSFLGCVGCAPQQPGSTPLPMKGFGSGAMIRPM